MEDVSDPTTQFHQPVLLKEVAEFLEIEPGKKYIDATVGGGGHAQIILKEGGKLLGIDFDPEAVDFAKRKLEESVDTSGDSYKIVKGNFKNIEAIAKEYSFLPADGILFDLGMSSWQIEGSGKGFSFLKDEPLDMRMDPALSVKAQDLLNGLTENELDELFSRFAEEKRSRTIAKAVVRSRSVRPFETTQELAGLLAWVEKEPEQDFWSWYEKMFAKDPKSWGDYGRRARIFQSLRIIVNDELNNLKTALPRALRILETGGRLVVISFHSLEDRIVKEFGKEYSEGSCERKVRILTPKPVRPSPEEVSQNPRSRSAMLRAMEKISQ
ncbi:MAG: 16S rRNA (cytosine(1402)-N(4))-methyltransferase RsmH [Patescibacteria group bacterium]